MSHTYQTSESTGYWRPLPLGYLLDQYGLFNKRTVVLLTGWIILFAFCLISIIYIVPSSWDTLESNQQAISLFLLFYPPLLICNFLLFWLGFEWGFIPAYLSTFMVALASNMSVYWALLFGISVVLGMGIFAIVYYSTRFKYTLKNLSDLAFFVGVAFIASMASSLGSLIWSHVQGLSIDQTLIAWKSWWSGLFLQCVLINAPILFAVGNRMEKLKDQYFDVPRRSKISIRWIYASIISVAAVLCIFIFSAEQLGRLRIQETLQNSSTISAMNIMGATETFELMAWITIALVITAGLAGIRLVGNWNSTLTNRIREKRVLLAEIHHRVKNNLALISGLIELQIRDNESRLLKEELRKSQSRIYSMAKVHEKTYHLKDKSEIKIDKYVPSIVDQIKSDYANDNQINFELNIDPTKLIMNQAVTFGLLLNELLIHTCKKTLAKEKSNTIGIRIYKRQDTVCLQLQDSGIGLPTDEEINQPNKLELILINKLSEQLKSDLDVHSDSQNGTNLDFTFKKENEKLAFSKSARKTNGNGRATANVQV